MTDSIKETTKTTTRVAILGAVGTVVAYLIDKLLPGTPQAVTTAVITLVLVGIDAYIHHSKIKMTGIIPF